jgi:hypothetical protein
VSAHSFERFPSGNGPTHDVCAAGITTENGGRLLGFARVEPVAISEERWELLREAQWSLREWERHRRDVDRERLIGALRTLAAIMHDGQ